MPPYEKFKFEFSFSAKRPGASLLTRRRELLNYLLTARDSNDARKYDGIQLAGIKNSTLEVNTASCALIRRICQDHPMAIVGTTSLVPSPKEDSLGEIVASTMVSSQWANDVTIWEIKSSSSLVKQQKRVTMLGKSHGGVYLYPLFAESGGIRLFVMYPVLPGPGSKDIEAEILDWIHRLSTTVLTLTPDEKPQAKNLGMGMTWSLDLKTLTQHFKASIEEGCQDVVKTNKHRSFLWHKTRSMVLHKLPLAIGGGPEDLERKLEAFISATLSSCRNQTVALDAFKAILDELQRENNVRTASNSDSMLNCSIKTEFFSAHSAKFAQLAGSLNKVLFLDDEDLDEEFELFVKKLAADTLPQYKSRGYYLELLELLVERSFEGAHKEFKEAYASKMQVFRNHDNMMEAKFNTIERMLQSAWETGELKDFVANLPNWYSFDLTGIKIGNGDFKLLPQYQLWTTKRHDYHEQCVRSAVETLELSSRKLERAFSQHFMDPRVVPLPTKLNHAEIKGLFKEKESIAAFVRDALDDKYDRLLKVTEARKASVEDRLARNERQLREEELRLMQEEFTIDQDQLNALALKDD